MMELWRPSKWTNLEKSGLKNWLWRIDKNLHVTDLDMRCQFGCVWVSSIKSIGKLKSAEAFMDRKAEKVKNSSFRKFWPIFRYFFYFDWYPYIFQNHTHWYFLENVLFRLKKYKGPNLDIKSSYIKTWKFF